MQGDTGFYFATQMVTLSASRNLEITDFSR